MALYDSVNGVARNVIKKYDGVNGVARKVIKAYDGVNGVARKYWDCVPVYTWKKYNRSTVDVYAIGYEDVSPCLLGDEGTEYVHRYTSYTFDSSAGMFTLSGYKGSVLNSEYVPPKSKESSEYIFVDSNASSSSTRTADGFSEIKPGALVTYDEELGESYLVINGYHMNMYATYEGTDYVQGSIYYGTVTSTDPYAYPDDWYLGSYWYVFVN